MSHVKRTPFVIIVLTFLAIAIPFYVSEVVGESAFHEWRLFSFLSRDFWYEKFGPGGPSQTRIDEFEIITIDGAVQPGSILGDNRCTHREFMSKLLNRVAQYDPRLIVIDKWYNRIPPGVCTGPVEGTADFRNAIRTVSAKIPLVIGVKTFTGTELPQRCDVEPEKFDSDQLVLGDYEPLNEGLPQDRVILGLVRYNADTRKVPLGWEAFADCDPRKSPPKIWPTLATAAASLLDPNILGGGELTEKKLNGAHPFTRLLPEGTFHSMTALSLVCNETGPNVDWIHCGEAEGDGKKLESLRHKVVIIGEKHNDQHRTMVGIVSGTHLQANYVAALLDGGVLNPTSPFVNSTATFAWLALLVYIFYWAVPKSPLLAAGICVLLTFLLGVFSAVVLKQFGLFADVVPPTIIEIVGLYLARIIEFRLDKDKESAADPDEVCL